MTRVSIFHTWARAAVCSAIMTTGAWAQAPVPGNGTPLNSDVPLLYCELQTVTSCEKGKACKAQDNFDGTKLPLKLTVNIPLSVIAFAEADGWVYTGKIGSAFENNYMIMIAGIGPLLSWQMQVYKQSDKGGRKMMSLQVGTADAASTGFGECEVAK